MNDKAQRRPGPPFFALWGAVLVAGIVAPAAARGNTIRVPEQGALLAVVAAAVAGDTVSIAPGNYDRVPAAFIKPITLMGRPGQAAPVLEGLQAGRCRLVGLAFDQLTGFSGPTVQIEALDSLTAVQCRFSGQTKTALHLNDGGMSHPPRIVLDGCTFDGLGQTAVLDFPGGMAGSQVALTGCSVTNCVAGITVTGADAGCTGGGTLLPSPAAPPPFDESQARLVITNSTFESVGGTAITVDHATAGLVVAGGRISLSGGGIVLANSGGVVRGMELSGNAHTGTGITVQEGRLVLAAASVRSWQTGLLFTSPGDPCPGSAGTVGGDFETSCAVAGNDTNLSASHSQVSAEYNFWGSSNCQEVLSRIVGLAVIIIVDETRYFPVDCSTPVVPSTWSDLKTRWIE